MKLLVKPVISLTIIGLTSCAPKMASTITGSDYNSQKDVTTYFVSPYAVASIPGKWNKAHYNKVSRQQFFTNNDSAVLSVAIGSIGSFEFSRKDLRGYDFVKSYFAWETLYQSSVLKLKTQLIAADSINRYIIWKAYTDSSNTIYLSGTKDCACNDEAFKNLTISSKKLTDESMSQFLTTIFLAK